MTYAEVSEKIRNGNKFDVICPNGEYVKNGKIASSDGWRVQVWNENNNEWDSFSITHCKVIFK